MQVGLAFGALLARIFVDFGAKLGGKLDQVGLSWRSYPVLSYLILPYLTLPYLILSYLGYLGNFGHRGRAECRGLGPTGLLREYPQEALQDRFLSPT